MWYPRDVGSLSPLLSTMEEQSFLRCGRLVDARIFGPVVWHAGSGIYQFVHQSSDFFSTLTRAVITSGRGGHHADTLTATQMATFLKVGRETSTLFLRHIADLLVLSRHSTLPS